MIGFNANQPNNLHNDENQVDGGQQQKTTWEGTASNASAFYNNTPDLRSVTTNSENSEAQQAGNNTINKIEIVGLSVFTIANYEI